MADNQKDVLIHIKTNAGESIEQIIRLDAELNDLNATMRKTKDDLSKLDQEFNDGKITEAQYLQETKRLKTELEAMNAEVKNINGEQRAYRKELENAAKAYEANEGSIKQMRAELSNMRKEYESLGKVEREGARGTEMLEKIQGTTAELKRLEEAQGDYRRSVGNYQRALEGISPTLTAVYKGINGLTGGTMDMNKAVQNAIPLVKNLGKQFLTLLSNPIVLTITAIVMTIKELVEQFRRTDDAMTALQQLFASFSPILETFRALLDLVVKALVGLISITTKAVTAVMSLVPGFREASEAAQEYVKALDQLEEIERRYAVQTAKNEVEIARLRNKTAQSDRYSVEERRKFLEDAIRLEKDNLNMEVEVAEQKWRLAVQDAARRKDTSDETKNTIADLEKAYYQAIANAEAGMRRMYSQMSQLNKQMSKESVDAWKKVMGSEVFGSAARKAADANYKKYSETLQKKAEDFKKIAESFPDGSEQKAEWEANTAQAQKEATEALENYQIAHKSMVDNLQSIYNDYRKNELSAQRGYEDAVLAGMDDTLDKQLQLIENEYKREIEDLKNRLETEEHLTKEARDYINKTIEEKQRQLNEKLILTEAKYWSEVRETARQTIDDIIAMNGKLAKADPNRIVGSFASGVRDSVRQAGNEMREESEKINNGYVTEYKAMAAVIANLFKSTSLDVSDNVKTALDSILNKTNEFAGKATENIATFINAVTNMRKRIGMTDKEYNEMIQLLRPYMKNITDYYNELIALPSKYQSFITNTVMNQMKEDAERIRKSMMDNFGQLMPDDYPQEIKNQIESVDNILYQTARHVNERLAKLAAIEKRTFADVYKEWITNELDWNIITGDKQADEAFAEMGEKYGKTFVSSFSGVLKYLTGTDNVNQQMEYIVTYYEDTVQRLEQINKDFAAAYAATGKEAFKNAMIDEGVFLPQLRKIYEEAKKYTDINIDWEGERLEIQGRYIGEADRELKVQSDLLALERERLDIELYRYGEQERMLIDSRDYVAEMQRNYDEVNTRNSAEITLLQKQLDSLRAQAAMFDETTEAATIAQNNAMINTIEQQIDNLRKATEEALRKLADTGFLSVDDLDKALMDVQHSIMATNNAIQANTQATANATTQIWLTAFTRVTGGLGQIGNAFNSLFTEMGELNDQWNAFAEASAYFTIGINMAEGIAEAVAAGSGVPWPANLAAIASGIAAVISGIAEATSVYNQYHRPQSKFADGGLIGGHYARTRAEGRRDDVNIKASRGEYVVNADTVKKCGVEFFDRINFGRSVAAVSKLRFADGGYVTSGTVQAANEAANMDNMRTMLSEVMSEIQPIVSVREITKAQNRVKVAETVARR